MRERCRGTLHIFAMRFFNQLWMTLKYPALQEIWGLQVPPLWILITTLIALELEGTRRVRTRPRRLTVP